MNPTVSMYKYTEKGKLRKKSSDTLVTVDFQQDKT